MEQFELEDLIIESIDIEDYDVALDYLRDYLADYGTDDFYFFSLSDILLAKKDYISTIELMEAAFDEGIDNDLLYERFGDAYYGIKNYQLALEWFLKCNLSEDNSNLLHTIYMIGLCYFLLGDYTNAIQYFEDVLLETESQEAFYNCAVSYLYVNKTKRACEYFEKVFDNDSLKYPICSELIYHGCINEARDFFDRLNESDYYLFDIWCSQFYESIESFDQAIDYAAKAYLLRPSDSLKSTIADLYLFNHEDDYAHKLYHEIIQNNVNLDDSQLDFVLAKLNAIKHVCDLKTQLSYLSEYEVFAENDCSIYISILNYSIEQKLLEYQDHLLFDSVFIGDVDEESLYALNDLYVLIHFNHHRYQDALNLLNEMPARNDVFYYRNKVIALYNLGRYADVVKFYEHVMPDGKFAIMMLDSFIKLDDEIGFDRVLEDMEDIHVDNVHEFYEVLSSILPTD